MASKLNGRIVFNRLLGENIFHLRVEAQNMARTALPGQFVQVRVVDSYQPLLRTPLSIHDCDSEAGTVDLLYVAIGESTRLLSQRQSGEDLDLIGPLGNGFEVASSDQPALLVAGGIGIAPLLYLARQQVALGTQTHLFFGARCPAALVQIAPFREIGVEVHLITDDGALGQTGTVIDLLKKHLSEGLLGSVYACGPRPMLGALQQLVAERRMLAQLSLEEYMACGIGACLGCTCAKTSGGYAHVCTEGPVFKEGEVQL